jgi:hypothetical protein
VDGYFQLLQRAGFKPILQGGQGGEDKNPKEPESYNRQIFNSHRKGGEREMKQSLLILAAGLLVAILAAQAQAATRMVLFEEWTNTG